MAQAGVGVDMLAVSRMSRVLERRPRFAEVAFCEAERRFCTASNQPARAFAECVAAHGAVKKALGVKPDDGVGLQEICLVRKRGEQPRVELSGTALSLAQRRGIREIALSLSYTEGVVVANAVALTDDVRPHKEEKADPKADLRASFKQARSVLDELEREGDSKKV